MQKVIFLYLYFAMRNIKQILGNELILYIKSFNISFVNKSIFIFHSRIDVEQKYCVAGND